MTRGSRVVGARVLRVELDVGGLDGELASRGHRIPSVGAQVHQDLLELADVGLDRAHVGGQHRHEVYIFPDETLQHLLHAVDDVVQVHDLGLEHLLTTERQELAGQAGGTLGRLAHLFYVLPLRIIRGQVLQQQVTVARDHGEQVVEVVRDPACQSPDRLHFLRLRELPLEAALLRDVTDKGFVVLDLARGLPHGPDTELHGQEPAILALPVRLHLVVFAVAIGVPLQETLALGGVGVHVARQVEPQHVRDRGVAEQAYQGGIRRQEPTLRGGAVDADRGAVHQGFEPGLGHARCRSSLGLAQLALDRWEEALQLPFGDPVARARLHGGHGQLLRDGAGDTNEGDVEAALAHQSQRLAPAEMRHAVVGDHEIPGLAVERSRHCGGGRHPLIGGIVPAALELAHQ